MPTKATNWSSFERDTTGALVDSGTGARIGPPTPSDLWLDAPAIGADPLAVYQIFDDFLNPATSAISDTMAWTAINDSGTGTPVFQDAAGGVFNVVTAAADNDHSAYSSVSEPFKFVAGKKLWFEMRFKCAEATILESTWWGGVMDTVTTGGMQVDALGPLATYIGALIWKTPETAMTVNFETSNAGTQTTLSAFATAITDTWHRMGFVFDGVGFITPYFSNGTAWTTGARQAISLTSTAEMHVVFGIKAGPTAAAETLQVDYIKCVAER